MSTRSLTHIQEDGKTLVTFYRHCDGYPEGHGKELAEFLEGFSVVNGLTGKPGKVANGMGCLAAQIISHFKDGPGQIYIYPADAADCGEEYVYTVSGQPEKPVRLSIKEAAGETVFEGNAGEVLMRLVSL